MNLTVKDLMKMCEECEGTGVAKPIRTKNSITQSLAGCPNCVRRGYVLTETGEAIAKLIEVLEKAR